MPPILDQVAEKLISKGVIDFSHKICASKGLVLPKINPQQTELINEILDAPRKKSIPKLPVSIEFTLREIFQHVQEKHPTVKVQFFGSFINYFLSQGQFVDALLDRLSLSEFKAELMSRFQQEPGDLDIRFFLPEVEDLSRDIEEIQRTIHHYFIHKIPEEFRSTHGGIYTKYIDPHHPNYFALIGITVNQDKQVHFSNTLDLYIDYLSGIRLWADALFLEVSLGSSEPYTLISECPGGVWQSIIDRIISVCQIERQHLDSHYHASNLNLYYLSRLYTKGFRCEDPEIEKRVFLLDKPEKYEILLRGTATNFSCPSIDYLTLKKFEKNLAQHPESALSIFLQASFILLSYNSFNNISTLWKIYAKESPQKRSEFESSLVQCLNVSPNVFPQIALLLTLHAIEVYNGTAISSLINKVTWTSHLQVPFLQIEINHSILLLPVDWFLQRNSYAEWNRLTDDEMLHLSPLIRMMFPTASSEKSAIFIKLHHLETEYHKYILNKINLEIASLADNSRSISREYAKKILDHLIQICVNEDQHRVLSKAIDLLNESDIGFSQIWMRALVESEQPKNWKSSLEIYKESSNDFVRNSESEKFLGQYFSLLWKRDPHLVYQTLEKHSSFDVVHSLLIEISKSTDCLSDSLTCNWIFKHLLVNKSLDNTLAFVKGPIFAKLIETHEELASNLLSEISKKGSKRESLTKLIETGLILLKSTDKTSFAGALLLSYISEFLPNKPDPKIVAQWNKINDLLTNNGKMHDLVNLLSWAGRAKVRILNKDQKATVAYYKAISLFVEKGDESVQKMKYWNQSIKFPNQDKIFIYQLQEDYKGIVKSLLRHHFYQEALEWLSHLNTSLDYENDATGKFDNQKFYFETLKECIPFFQDETSLQEALQLLFRLNTFPGVVDFTLQLLINSTSLSDSTKSKILAGLLKDKNPACKEAIISSLQKYPKESLQLLESLVNIDKASLIPFVQLALPLLQVVEEELRTKWKPIIRTAFMVSQRTDFIDSVSTVYHYLFHDDDHDVEVFQAILQKELPIPTNLHFQMVDVCKNVIEKGPLQNSIKSVLWLSKQDFFVINLTFKSDLLSYLLRHILLKEAKQCDFKVVHLLQQLFRENVDLKETPNFLSAIHAYASRFQLDFPNEMQELAKLFECEITLAPEMQQELIKREKVKFNALMKQKPYQNLSEFCECLPYLTPEDIQVFVENVLTHQSKIERFETVMSMLLDLSNVSITSWITFFELLCQKSTEDELIHPIYTLSYRVLEERLYPHFSSKSTTTPGELSSLIYAIILLPTASENIFLKHVIENPEEYLQLFNHPSVDRKERNQFYVQLVVKTAAIVPLYDPDEVTDNLTIWKGMTEKIKEVVSGGIHNEESIDWIACQAWISIGELIATSRAGNPDEFKSLQHEIQIFISLLFNCNMTESEITNHFRQFLSYFISVLQVAPNDRKATMLLWASARLSNALDNFRILKFKFFKNFVQPKYLDFNHPSIVNMIETLSEDLIKIGENPVMEEKLAPNIFNEITLKYLLVIDNIHSIPYNQRTFEQNQLFTKSIGLLVENRFLQSDSIVKENEVSVYKIIDDADVMNVIFKNPDKQAQNILYFLLKLKIVSVCLSRLENDPFQINRKMAIEFLNSIKETKFDDSLSKENYFMLLSQLICFPIPDICLGESWSGIPTRLSLQMVIRKSQTSPSFFKENPIEAFKAAYPLGLYGNIPEEITTAQLLLGVKELVEDYLVAGMSNIHHLKLGLKIFNIRIEGESYNEKIQDKIELLRVEYPVLYFYTLLNLLETWPKGLNHIKHAEQYYGPMMIRLIDMIKDDQERLMKVVHLMGEISLELSESQFDAFFQSLQAYAFDKKIQKDKDKVFTSNFIQIMLSCGRIVPSYE